MQRKYLDLLYLSFFRMLEDFGNEMESADAKMDATMKKVAKIMHMTNGSDISIVHSAFAFDLICFESFSCLRFVDKE